MTDAIELLNHSERIVAYDVQSELHDIGNKLGFVQATIGFALEREELIASSMENTLKKIYK